jgi:uncharacterized protein (TIGR03437 family)
VFKRSCQFLIANKYGVALWLGIALIMWASVHRSPPSPGVQLGFDTGGSGSGGSGNSFCTWVSDIDDYFCGSSDINVLSPTGQAGAIRFERNVGQADMNYSFVAHGRQQMILVSSAGAEIQLGASKKMKGRTIRASLEGARTGPEPLGEHPLSGHVNYLIGRDPQNWHTDIPTFARVRSAGVYPHIDAVYHGSNGDLETDFVVEPGGDPESIHVRFDGADEVRMESDETLSVHADTRTLSWKKPALYQVSTRGFKTKVEGRFRLEPDGAVGFEVGPYDVTRPLVIDPVLTYATYFGTPYADGAARVAADASGNAYIIGSTDDNEFPVTPGAFYTAGTNQGNVLVAKVAPDGKSMVYETHLGGSNGDLGWGITVDPTGNVYLTGATGSGNFPLVPASNNMTTNLATDPLNCFVTKLNAAGNGLVYSTVLGGSGADGCSSIGVDSAGNAYVVGVTFSSDFPLKNAVQTNFPVAVGSTSSSAFVAKLNAAGTQLQYSTYFGGSGGVNAATAVAVDSAGDAYFTGFTTSGAFPVSSGSFRQYFGGYGGQFNPRLTTGDAFVVKMSPSGQKLYATYLGGSRDDIGVGIAIDAQGDAYVGGATLSSDFPTQNPFQKTYGGAGGDQNSSGGDGFIAELDPTGSTLVFSSYIGGTNDDRVLGVALDSSGNIYLAGHTLSSNFPTAGTQAQSGYAGDSNGGFRTGDAFVAQISSAHALAFSTYLGGSAGDWAGGVAVDGTGGIIIAGGTTSSNFPATTGVYQTKYGGTDPVFNAAYPIGDAFIAKFGGTTSPVLITGISNAASYVGGSIAPGEVILIAGNGIGPASIAGAALTPQGTISASVANTQFTFNGVAAPIIYVSSQYSSVIVPYEVSTTTSAQVVATVNGVSSPPFTMPVAATVPGVFSANSSGTGEGAILNQNLTHNSAQNPATRGSFVVVYITGEGQTVPPGIDGSITPPPPSPSITPALPVSVSFGGVPATSIEFAGETPGVVAGVMQINVYVPQLAQSGVLPLTVTIGTVTTQSGLTVAVQ